MADVELFDIATFHTEKASNVIVTATTSGAPQTVVTLTTPSLPAGTYNFVYAWQAQFFGKDRPLFFKIGGTYADAQFFSNASGSNNALHVNRLYGYPKVHAGGPVTMSLEMYDPLTEAIVEFCDVVISRVA